MSSVLLVYDKEPSDRTHKYVSAAHAMQGLSFHNTQWITVAKPQHLALFDERVKTMRPQSLAIMGNVALQLLCNNAGSIDSARGYPLKIPGHKVYSVPTLSPYDVYKRPDMTWVFRCDLAKAHKIASIDGYEPRMPLITVIKTVEELVAFVEDWLKRDPLLSWDTEYKETRDAHSVTVMSFSETPHESVVIPLIGAGGDYWSESDEQVVWKLLDRVLTRCRIVGHNAVHADHFQMGRYAKIVPNLVEDTMLLAWEISCESKKSLGFLGSVYSTQPSWKGMRTGHGGIMQHYIYNGFDTAGTMEIFQNLNGQLTDLQNSHYRFNIQVSRALQYCSLKGVRVDEAKHKNRLNEIEDSIIDMQGKLQKETGVKINPASHVSVKNYLYKHLKLPVKTKRVKGEYKDTSDRLALMELAWEFPEAPGLKTLLDITKAQKRLSNLDFTPINGRVYCTYNVVGTETCRVTAYKAHPRWGVALQTVDRDDRDLYVADSVEELWIKADLEGADSWTVAMIGAAYGDSSMLDDLMKGLKPAKRLLKEYFGPGTPQEVKDRYMACKAVVHGTTYGMQPKLVSQTIFKWSQGTILFTAAECERLQVFLRKLYPAIGLYQTYVKTQLNRSGCLESFVGTRRQFLGRVSDTKVQNEALATLPQIHTTYVTNRTLLNIYNNHLAVMRPVHQMHDEVDFMCHKSELDYCREGFAEACKVSITFKGYDIQIPFGFGWGPNWKDLEGDD